MENHPARDTPLDRSGFVKTEVDPRGCPQNVDDPLKICRAHKWRFRFQHDSGSLGEG
jgi:hypothetical protein